MVVNHGNTIKLIIFTVVKFSNDSQVLFNLINREVEVSNIQAGLLKILDQRLRETIDATLLQALRKME